MPSWAQQEADAMVAQAQDYARRVTERARQQYDDVVRAAYEQAQQKGERAVQEYRARSGGQYRPEHEEMEQRLAWIRTFLGAMQSVETQLKAAREAMSYEVGRLRGVRVPTAEQRMYEDRP